MPDWLINIVTVKAAKPGDPTAKFEPSPQICLQGDNITWSNRTGDPHTPVPSDAAAAPWGVNQIPPGQSSNPMYSVLAPQSGGQPVYGIVKYQSSEHPDVIGELNIVAVPPTFT